MLVSKLCKDSFFVHRSNLRNNRRTRQELRNEFRALSILPLFLLNFDSLSFFPGVVSLNCSLSAPFAEFAGPRSYHHSLAHRMSAHSLFFRSQPLAQDQYHVINTFIKSSSFNLEGASSGPYGGRASPTSSLFDQRISRKRGVLEKEFSSHLTSTQSQARKRATLIQTIHPCFLKHSWGDFAHFSRSCSARRSLSFLIDAIPPTYSSIHQEI